MCTFNGEAFLSQQLRSLSEQIHQNWHLYASDDGSNDATLTILNRFADEHPEKVTILAGPKQGVEENFKSLIVNEQCVGDFFAFCDQDDVWDNDHLSQGASRLSSISSELPALSCGRTALIDEAGTAIGFSPAFMRPPSFRNAVVQSLAGGNTMVFNRKARDYLAAAARADSVAHDWWAYQIVSGSGGVVYYNPKPTVRYRQHRSNVVGANTGWRARYRRFKFMCAGRFAVWTTRNLGALHSVRHLLTSENAQLLNDVEKLRVGSVFSRLSTLWRSKIHRQTTMGNIGLTIAVILKRL